MAKAKKTNDAATATTENVFSYRGKKYKAIKGADIPMPNGSMRMTAADIAADEATQKYVVENKCSCIEEVIG